MNENSNIFINKKILIYGLGKSGISSFKYLKNKNQTFLYDDNKKIKLRSHLNNVTHTIEKNVLDKQGCKPYFIFKIIF